ncbi:MAG: Gfo/Idh/MocA family oxidoreductase [Verrucomicrobia bacterium]|nr:Gfo/Idh/MocA family oxidoreductase [Verrucomicrobiota bacterium]
MKTVNRRTFLKHTLWTTAAVGLMAPLRPFAAAGRPGRVVGPNEEIRFAVVGFGGRGGDHIKGVMTLREQGEKVRLVALCDADKEVLEQGVKSLADRGTTVKGYVDVRQLLEDEGIDAVTFATPNHWHSLNVIWSVQAGKDVYVEKPISHNVWEGRQAVAAARKYDRIVQAGTQSRSSQGIRDAVAWVQAGNLGRIRVARGLCYKRRASIGKVDGPQPIPPEIDYDLWCGPAPKDPLMRKRLHYDWHWVWPTGNGDLGNQGIHQMDIARWFLGETTLSPRVLSVGGRLGYVDDGTTPNTQMVFHDYEQAPLIFEVRGLPERAGSNRMDQLMGGGVAVIIHCEGGHVLVPNYYSAIAYDQAGKELRKWEGAKDHYANFIQAVRSRKSTDLTADILEGHLSSALCHTGNVSYLLGRTAAPGEIREAIRAQRDAEATFQRMLEHLKVNEVDVDATPLTLGPVLTMNPAKERFVRNRAANQLLTRDYREPYVVSAQV